MSIWSRNHAELASLAKTLQDRNVETRNKLSKRLADLNLANPLDPRKSRSESCLASIPRDDAKDNILSRIGDNEADIGPLKRLRVDSFSSVDSAISPDFHRSPLSPILKHANLGSSFPGSRKSSPCSKVSDKRVTFLLMNGDSDENEFSASDNGCFSNTGHSLLADTDLSDVKDNVDCYPSDSIDNVTVSLESEIIRKSDKVIPLDEEKAYSNLNNCQSQNLSGSGSFKTESGMIPHESSQDHNSIYSSEPETIKPSTDISECDSNSTCQSNSDPNADTFVDNTSSSFHKDSGTQFSKYKSTSVEGLDEKVTHPSTGSSDLNLSSELNLLLISLMANYRREQLLKSQKENQPKDATSSTETKLLQSSSDSDQQNVSNSQNKNEHSSHEIDNSNGSLRLIITSSNDVTREEPLRDIDKLKTVINTDREMEMCIDTGNENGLNSQNNSTNLPIQSDDEVDYTAVSQADPDFAKGDTKHIYLSSHKDTHGSDVDNSEHNLSSFEGLPQMQTISSIPLPIPLDNDISHQNQISKMQSRQCCVIDASAKYTVAGHAPSTFIYSHLYQQPMNHSRSSMPNEVHKVLVLTKPQVTSADNSFLNDTDNQPNGAEFSDSHRSMDSEILEPIQSVENMAVPVIRDSFVSEISEDLLNSKDKDLQNQNHPRSIPNHSVHSLHEVETLSKQNLSEKGLSLLDSIEVSKEKNSENPHAPGEVIQIQSQMAGDQTKVSENSFPTVRDSRCAAKDVSGCSVVSTGPENQNHEVLVTLQTSTISQETPECSYTGGRRNIENKNTEKSNIAASSANQMAQITFESAESVSECASLDIDSNECSVHQPKGCVSQLHENLNSPTISPCLKQYDSLSSGFLSSPGSTNNNNVDTPPSGLETNDTSFSGKEEASYVLSSSYASEIKIPLISEVDTMDVIEDLDNRSQSDCFRTSSYLSEAIVYSEDTVFQSSTDSLPNNTSNMRSLSSSSKQQRRHSKRRAKAPSYVDLSPEALLYHRIVAHKLHIDSSSYDSDETSLFWSGKAENSKTVSASQYIDSRYRNKRLSPRDQLSRFKDNIFWILQTQNSTPHESVQHLSRQSRKKKKSHHRDYDSNPRHMGHEKRQTESHREKSPSKFEFRKTSKKQHSAHYLNKGELKERPGQVLESVSKHHAIPELTDQRQLFSNRLMVKEFQKVLKKIHSPEAEPYPSKDLKTVKDNLHQLSVYLRQQRRCNKRNVMKEISERSKLFCPIFSPTETLESPNNLTNCSASDKEKGTEKHKADGVPENQAVVDGSHEREEITPSSSPNPRAPKVSDRTTTAQKVDLTFMEDILDKVMHSSADDLCHGDVLQCVIKQWQSIKQLTAQTGGPSESPEKLSPIDTPNGMKRDAVHQTTQSSPHKLLHSSFSSFAKTEQCKAGGSSSAANETSSGITDLTQSTNETSSPNNQFNGSQYPTSASHVSKSLGEQETLSENEGTDDRFCDNQSPSEDQEIFSIMESDSQLSFQMDREFDKYLADMKPYVLKLPLKTDRQKCAVWIKKFCDPPGSGINVRKNRNMYAQLMLQMLKKGTLASPFDHKPDIGPLQPLPSYMSIYFDDPLASIIGQAERLPDWVEGELGDTAGSSVYHHSLGNPAATSTWVSSLGDLRERPHSSMGHTLDKDPSLSPIRNSEFVHSKGYSVDDMSIEVKQSSSSPSPQRRKSHNSPEREKRQLPDIKIREEKEDRRHQDYSHNDTDWSKPYTSSISLPKGTTFHEDISYQKPADREVAVRTKMIEAKFHEEKLKLQQKHDAAVQKILDRKNTEIEDVKNHYRGKSREMEETIGKLDKKVQTLMKETEFVRESKDKQMSEMKKLAEDSNENRRKEFEKRLHDIMSEFEQEKFDMQKQHTQNIQEILDDTNNRLQRMEAEYSQQTTTTTNVIKELESRVQQLMNEVDSSLSQRSAVEKDRNETQAKLEKLTDEYERLRERHHQMERDHHVKTETHEHELRSLKNKTEASLEFLKQEHTMAASKASDTISDFEQKVDQLKKSLKDSEETRHRQNRELEQVHQQDKLHVENLHDKQVRNMKKEMEQLESDWSKKLSKVEQQIKDKEGEISKLREQKQQQAIQSEQALEEFKSQVEKNQARMYEEMRQQMEQVENDLSKSKQLREKQSKEFGRQQEEDKYKHQHEIAELKMAFEGEKSQLMRDFHVQKEYIISEHDKEVENHKDVHRAEIQAIEARMRERQDKSEKSATDAERLIRELREELVQANQLRKQQLVELGLLREEEKQKVQRDHEAELSRLRTDMEQQRLEQQKVHSTEMESVLEKTNERLKGIEKEYAERGNKSAESIAELQSVVLQLRGDIKRSRESSDEKLAELKHQYEEERQNLRKQYAQNMMSMQKELESQQTKSRDSERQLQRGESDHEEKITQLKLQFEEKIRGLMPAVVKQELEDTIASLKSQVASLQQRGFMLQEELESINRSQLGPFGSRTSSPIKSSV